MQEDSKQNTLPLVPAGIAKGAGGETPVLIGGFCPECGLSFFPRPKYCPRCLGTPRQKELPKQGVIHSFTVVRTRPPLGLPQPYAVGYVDLAATSLRIFGLFDPRDIEDLAMGQPVRVNLGPVGKDNRGEPCLRPYFSLVEKGGGHG